jgi:DNA-binding NarL/FixJ family response regulator
MNSSSSKGSPQRSRVFVVDDHPLVREWLVSLINRQPDLEVCGQAEGARAALSLIADQRPQVVIVDLSLKEGSGLDVIKDIRAQHPSIQILVLSMHEEPYYAERAFRAGARGYITKRESTGRIVEGIHQVLGGKVYASNELLGQLAERLAGGALGKSESPADLLSDRELEVFQLLGRGLETKEIARQMSLNIKTVQAYAARIKDKLHLDNVSELMREAVKWVHTGGQ